MHSVDMVCGPHAWRSNVYTRITLGRDCVRVHHCVKDGLPLIYWYWLGLGQEYYRVDCRRVPVPLETWERLFSKPFDSAKNRANVGELLSIAFTSEHALRAWIRDTSNKLNGQEGGA